MRRITRSATVPWWPHKPKESLMILDIALQVANITVEMVQTITNITVEL